jgi:hypothetical protein
VRQQRRRVVTEGMGEANHAVMQECAVSDYPDVCVFCSLFFPLPTKPEAISLCTPVELEWLLLFI